MKIFEQISYRKFFLCGVLLALFVSAAIAQTSSIKLNLDAADAPKNILHVRQTMPVTAAGNFSLFYPKWIPGEHSLTGTLNDLVNLFINADGKPLEWQRDDVEMFAFRINIPEGAKHLEVSFDYAAQPGTTTTANLARIKWNRLILYPRGAKSDDVQVTASMKLPNGWKYATSLPIEKESTNTVDFKPVNLTTFVDSPAIIGKYFTKIPLSLHGGAPTEIDIAAETADALKYKPETLTGWQNLIVQATQMFGARHYNSYKFLLTLSDNGGDNGLEHHESSEDGVGETALSDEKQLLALGDLLGHEYAHSWNGKYRRPDKLTTPDFEQPMQGELLWVYEGLTQYLGRVLPTRSGLWTDEMFREAAADTAAQMDLQTGRRWRPLVDTSRNVQFGYSSPRAWMNSRRRADYYHEGSLIWMETDVLIREKSGGKLSLDDFLRKFHGGQNSGAMVKPYDFEEIVKTLNAVLPYDWRAFFIERVYKTQKNAPLGGITNGGWKLIYNDTPNKQGEIDASRVNSANLMYSIGIIVNNKGTILDINSDLTAAKAGFAPGMTIKKINGKEFSVEELRKTVAATKNVQSAIKFEVENGSVSNTLTISYKGGEKFPHLVRDAAKADYLSAITKPLLNLQGFLMSGPRSRISRPEIINVPAEVKSVLLNQTEITAACAANSKSCSEAKRSVEVLTEAFDPENDDLVYNYTVTGGRISGQGTKVIWDLSGVKTGTYTITVGADDGCGICGKTVTKEVKIIECPNCD